MDIEKKHIPEDAEYLAERVSGLTYKLFLWRESFYEVSYRYGSEDIRRIEQLEDENTLNLYIASMHRPGTTEPCEYDRYETLTETGQIIATILKTEHQNFYLQLLWDQKLRWYCNMLEVRAAYLIDKIKTGDMKVPVARDIAIRELLKADPQRHITPPYITKSKEGMIRLPKWFQDKISRNGCIIEDDCAYGDGLNQVLGKLKQYGSWKDETSDFPLYKKKNTN